MWGLVAKLDISDDNSRRMILQKLAEDRQIILPEEVTGIGGHLPRDITALTARSPDRIKHHSFATQRENIPAPCQGGTCPERGLVLKIFDTLTQLSVHPLTCRPYLAR